MRVVYIGSGDIGLPSLRWLLDAPGIEVCGVVTQPDKAAGRGLRVAFSSVKELALSRNVPVLQPRRLRDPGAVSEIAALAPDLLVVMAYGQILPKALLDVPPQGALNLHASLLPRHRGAAPIHAALLAGDAESGITVMWMDEGLDTGDILLAKACPLGSDETAGSLHDRLADLAAVALEEAVARIRSGTAARMPQDPALATYAPKLDRSIGRLDWSCPAPELARRVRALHPWPGCTADLELQGGKHVTVKIHAAECVPGNAPAGLCDGLLVGCGGGGLLRIVRLQPAGGRAMSGPDFLRGHSVVRAVA